MPEGYFQLIPESAGQKKGSTQGGIAEEIWQGQKVSVAI